MKGLHDLDTPGRIGELRDTFFLLPRGLSSDGPGLFGGVIGGGPGESMTFGRTSGSFWPIILTGRTRFLKLFSILPFTRTHNNYRLGLGGWREASKNNRQFHSQKSY